MPILFTAGETIRAGKLNRLQPVTYRAVGTGTVAAGSTNAMIPSCTLTFNTQAANAIYVAYAIYDVDATAVATGTFVGRLYVDGVTESQFATWSGEVATDRSTVGQNFRGTLAVAGSHTLDLRVVTQTGQVVQGVNSTLTVVVYEQN